MYEILHSLQGNTGRNWIVLNVESSEINNLIIDIEIFMAPIGFPFKDNLVRAKFSMTPTQIVKHAVASMLLLERRRVFSVLLSMIASPRAKPPSCPKLLYDTSKYVKEVFLDRLSLVHEGWRNGQDFYKVYT